MNKRNIEHAISIRQPWAELILRGEKTIEVRTWSSTYRGDLYLHTGKMADGYKHIDMRMPDVFRGGYVGVIELAAVVRFTSERWEQWRPRHQSDGAFTPGTYAWIVRNPRRFRSPVPGPGQLGLFRPDSDMVAVLELAEFVA